MYVCIKVDKIFQKILLHTSYTLHFEILFSKYFYLNYTQILNKMSPKILYNIKKNVTEI